MLYHAVHDGKPPFYSNIGSLVRPGTDQSIQVLAHQGGPGLEPMMYTVVPGHTASVCPHAHPPHVSVSAETNFLWLPFGSLLLKKLASQVLHPIFSEDVFPSRGSLSLEMIHPCGPCDL